MFTALLEKLLPPAAATRLADGRMRPSGGGLVAALIGGDGSGKSTCARELESWLEPEFPTMRAHMGNPPRSLLTLLAGAGLRLQRNVERWLRRPPKPGSSLELFRHVCTARDRYRLCQRVHRFAVAGGIAVCERYPVRPDYVHVAPVIPELLSNNAGGLAQWLRQAEASYYSRIFTPDALFVLKLDPELAVLRKPEEPADYVRARGRMIWETDWSRSRARVVDASQPLPDVVRQLKTAIWSIL
jgi:thymidylate kinase